MSSTTATTASCPGDRAVTFSAADTLACDACACARSPAVANNRMKDQRNRIASAGGYANRTALTKLTLSWRILSIPLGFVGRHDLRLSKRTEYGLRAVVQLARLWPR